ncbi:MAG: VCBS repeat-containing protein [Saprospiraceae bacterium]
MYKILYTSLAFFFFVAMGCQDKPATTVNPETEKAPANALFELLNPEQCGVVFSNHITEDFSVNILNNSYLYNGGGVAVLDVNNDGLMDLYLSATQEPNRLFLNKGNMQFEDITMQAGVAADRGIKTGVTIVDINADGWDDIYVCRSGTFISSDRANLLFVNNGDGTFAEKAAQYGLNDASASNHANFFDYDNDGDLDVYILNHPVAFQDVNKIRAAESEDGGYTRQTEPLDQYESDKLFRNDGNRFVDVSNEAGIRNRAWGLSVTVTDFNNDGWQDVFVGNDYIEPDLVYINNRNGTFSVQTDNYFRHMSNHTMGVDIADCNNDGLVDVVALDMIAEDNQRQKELMTTMLLDRYNNLVRFQYGHQIMRNVLQLNTGAEPGEGAPFSDIGQLAGVSNTDWSWSPLMADFDNDGLKDLYITNGYRRDISNLDYLNYTVDSVMKMGGLTTQNFKTIDDYLKLIPSTPLRNYMFRNVDGINFENTSVEWGVGQRSYSNGSAWADLDNDGDLDLVVNNIHGDAFVFKNKAADQQKGNWLQVGLKGSEKNPRGTGAKIRIRYGDGKMQYQEMTPTRGFFSSSQQLFHFGLGSAAKVDVLEIWWGPDGRVQRLTDVQPNQRITLNYDDAKPGKWEALPQPDALFAKATNTGIDFRHVEDEFIDFNRERLLPHKFSNLGPDIAVGDVNGDGLEDFFVGGATNQAGALYLQNRSSKFRKARGPWQADAIYEDMGSVFFDADGDGDLDLYVASGGSSFPEGAKEYQDRLYLNDGRGNFQKASDALPEITTPGSRVAVFDFDDDGDQDVFVGGLVVPGKYPSAPHACLLRNDGGKFTDVCSQVAPELQILGMIFDLKWADLDGDQKAELVAVGEWLPPSVFKMMNGKLQNVTQQFGLKEYTGWWNCVHLADLDGDGDQDIIAGNMGLNSRLKASKEEPLRLFANDFDANGQIDPVLAYYNNGKLYPLPLRDMMIKQMPPLKKKYVRYKAYGEATIEDVFPKSDLNSSLQLAATTFATMWFENRNGKLVAHQLPTEAQFSPVNQVISADFNGDGNVDLLLAGNSYSPEVETGRYDAGNGTLLLGDGKGGWTFMPNRYAGFWATKEARDIKPVKLANGRVLILVANNNDRLEAYISKSPVQ